ncbi:nonstructural protein [Blackfly microvirus SF02]|uniref:Nonstructural protein n=1 Tax=Blackfly microvirus SF02 TaxID=2576452 RepID=A0A4P8PL68_9VIRU|nr:nonstructural protein [Blackfly microvirus SF02]
MRLMLCSVKDVAVQAYQPPYVARAPGEASRMFADACRDPERTGVRHPQDLILYHLGWWDDGTGEFEVLEKPEVMVTGASLAEK